MTDAWLDDVEDADESDDETTDESEDLFSENFRELVEDDDVESMNVTTISDNIADIEDPELLADAIQQDSRATSEKAYRDRLGDLNAEEILGEDEDEGDDDTETSTPGSKETAHDADEQTLSEDKGKTSSEKKNLSESVSEPLNEDSELPEVNVSAIAPNATAREDLVGQETRHTLLAWGREGVGKTHVAHSAPEPICYLDTEGKGDELAEKFAGKRIWYWQPENYAEATDALDEAMQVLGEFYGEGIRGTLVVDSMSVLWEWAQVHHMLQTRPGAETLAEVEFESSFGSGDGDWQEIKGYHNTKFRDRILDSPFHVVFTAGLKEAYDYDEENSDFTSRFVPDGEKWNRHAVKDVVRLRTGENGNTVADLQKAAKTRYSFVGLEWPEWDKIYGAIEQLTDAEMAEEDVDVTDWPFEVVEGQPVETDEGDDDDE